MFTNICNLTSADWVDNAGWFLAATGLAWWFIRTFRFAVWLPGFTVRRWKAARGAVKRRLRSISIEIYGARRSKLLSQQLQFALFHGANAAAVSGAAYVAWFMPAAEETMRLLQVALAVMTTFAFVTATAAPAIRTAFGTAFGFLIAQYRALDAFMASSEQALREAEAALSSYVPAVQAARVKEKKRASIRLVKVGPVREDELLLREPAIEASYTVVTGRKKRLMRRRA